MFTISQERSNFINFRQVEYSLGNDYGIGGHEVTREKDGQVKWTAELKD